MIGGDYLGKYYVIFTNRGSGQEIIRTTSKEMYESLIEILKWTNPASLMFVGGSVWPLEGKHYTAREFWSEFLES